MRTAPFVTAALMTSLLVVAPGPASAGEIPAGVRPQEGRASAFEPSDNAGYGPLFQVTITFWNVGELGDQGDATYELECIPEHYPGPIENVCTDQTIPGTFSGGPRGTLTLEDGQELRLVDGSFFLAPYHTSTMQVPLENPEIFGAWHAPDSGARFSDFAGTVEIRPGDDEEGWNYAQLESVLQVDMHIKTGPNSTAIISFADMTTFTLGPNSEIVLSSPAGKDSQIQLLLGKMWMNVKKMLKDGSMEVEMSQAVAGIKGTVLALEETGTTSTVMVVRGKVRVDSTESKDHTKVKAGRAVTADADGLGLATRFDVQAEKAEKASWSTEA